MEIILTFIYVLFAIFLLIVVLFIDYYLATCFYEVACEKGHIHKKYLYICFFFCFAGYLLVCSLPDRKTDSIQKPKKIQFSTTSGHKWHCPNCGVLVPEDMIRCKCGYSKNTTDK